ncbi:hypothetical protein ACHAXA_009608 [Cyclostephanos tholiformis]|uniref:SET domain-containing protein n=1 Tax=Cyclostephanos tholiformis TaxID=382380 RepID=A0ABD3RGC2_9STRA
MLPLLLQISRSLPTSSAFSFPIRHRPLAVVNKLTLAAAAGGSGSSNGEGGEAEWVRALLEAGGGGKNAPGKFEEEMKMRGLLGPDKGKANPKLTANSRLISWLENEGGVYLSETSTWGEAPHPLAISTETVDEITNESSGRGLLARRSINEGDELLRIPLDLCITRRSARGALGKDALPEGINEYLAMACQLIREKYVLGERSFYAPYVGVLPEVEEVNPTFTWPDADLDFLRGSPIVAATRSLRMKLRREFPPEHYTYDNWVWAFTMLFSRAIRLRNLRVGERLALVPYADLINHSAFSQAFIDARESGDWLFKDGEEEVILYADRGYRQMEQVYISYGQKSNAELLLLYGFALERNPYNSVDVTVSISPRTAAVVAANEGSGIEEDPLARQKLDFLASVGRGQMVDFPCYADRYPVEMLEYLRLMMMTPEDTRGKPLMDFDYSRTISSANEAAVLQSVVSAVRYQLSLFPQTEEDDAAIIKDKATFRLLSYNQRMAVRHRRNEKRLLKRTLAALEKQIRNKGLDEVEVLTRAEGSTLGEVLKGETRKQKTALEDKLEKMGLPVDIR